MPPHRGSAKISPNSLQNILLGAFVLITICIAALEFFGSSPAISSTRVLQAKSQKAFPYPISEDSPTICTYFEPYPSHRQDEFRAVVKIWNQSWTRQGWNTRVFSEKDAAKYPDYEKLKKELLNLPTVNDQRFEISCYIRWVAMVAAGCRWMSDIDLMNFGFPPQHPWHGPVLYSFGGVMPALVTGSTEAFQNVIDTFRQISRDPLSSSSVIRVNGNPHVSDMLVFAGNPQMYLPVSFPLYASVPKSLGASPVMHFSFDDAQALRKGSKLELIYETSRIQPDYDPYSWPPTVCTYTPGPDAGPGWEEALETWTRSWSAQGWTTQVLAEADAARHPRYSELRGRLVSLEASDPEGKTSPSRVARYLRWVAMVATGCRWLSDVDVVNFGFPPQPPWHGPVLYSYDGPEPTLVTGGLAAFEAVLAAMEEAAIVASRDPAAAPPAVTSDGRAVVADARVLGARPELFLDIYFPLNISYPGPRDFSPLLHLDPWDVSATGKTREKFLASLRPIGPDPHPPKAVLPAEL